jgi:hypothetical protein
VAITPQGHVSEAFSASCVLMLAKNELGMVNLYYATRQVSFINRIDMMNLDFWAA